MREKGGDDDDGIKNINLWQQERESWASETAVSVAYFKVGSISGFTSFI